MHRIASGVILILFLTGSLSLVLDILPARARALDFKEQGANVALASFDDDWPMFHHDAFHSGYSTSIAPDTNNTIWAFTVSGRFSSPVAAYNRVYVSARTWSGNGMLCCLNASTGAWLWNYTTGNYLGGSLTTGSSPSVADGKVYCGLGGEDKVFCLDAKSGEYVWSYTTGGNVESSPTVVNGMVYIGSEDWNIYCLNASTGSLVWNYTTGGSVYSSPAVVDGMVYVGSDDYNVYCLDALTGAHVWNYTTGGNVESSPTVVNGMVYIGSGGDIYENVYCLNASTGSLAWNSGYGAVYSSPAVAYDKVYVEAWSWTYGSAVYCLDGPTGEYIWDYKTGSDLTRSSPAVADGKVYVGSDNGSYYASKFYCIDAFAGTPIWNYTIDGDVNTSPAVAYDRVFISVGPQGYGSLSIIYCFSQIPVLNVNTGLGYATIQEAIDAPETLDGHTILVGPGTYNEHVVLDKSLSLVGTDRFKTIIDGNLTGTVINIISSNVTITGFTIQNSGPNYPNSGLYLLSSSGNNISYNIITNNYHGIYIDSSRDNIIYHNSFIDNSQQAYVGTSDHNTWDNGYRSGGNYWSNYTGTDKYHGPNQDIAGPDGIGDTAQVIDANNRDNYPLMTPVMKPVYNLNTGLQYVSIQQAISADETLDGHRIQLGACTYFEHVVIYKSVWLSGPPTPSEPLGIIDGGDSGTVIHARANDVFISDLTIQNSGSDFGECGVYVECSYNCSVSNNKLQNNRVGVFLDNSSNCRLDSNYAHNNSECGLYVSYSENCEVYMNKANDNFYGIQISHSTNCIIYGGNEVSDNEYGILLDGSQSCLVGVLLDTPQGYRISGNRAFSNEYGICVANCQDCDIAYMNTAENNTYGIWLKSSKHCWVGASRNGSTLIEEERSLMTDFVENNEYGIRVDRSEDCQVEEGALRKNRYGVWIDSSRNCQIQIIADGNTLGSICLSSSKNCLVQGSVDIYGSYVVADGILLRDSEDCVVSGTQVNHIGRKDGQSVCVDLDRCQNCTVERTLLEGAHVGVLVENSSNCLLLSNHISNTLGGIFLDISDKCIISDNDIGNNGILGIELVSSSSCIIKENRIHNNTDYGVYLASDQDTFYHNLFFNNAKNIENAWVNETIGGYNTWDDGHEGNYWDDYKGFDTDNDRIGETPYIIDGKNIDFYPLIGSPSEDYRPPVISSCAILNALPSTSNILKVNPLDVVKIQAQVTDQQTGIKQVTLYYGVGDLLNYSVSMVKTAGDWFNGTYEGWICPWIFLNGSSWNGGGIEVNITFRVEATDYPNNVGTSENMTFSTAEQRNTLDIDITILKVNTQDELSVDLNFALDGYLPGWMGDPIYLEADNWREGTRTDTAQLSMSPTLLNGRSTLNYQGILSQKFTLIGKSESYPFDSYYLNLTFRLHTSLPRYLSDQYWTNVYSDAFRTLEENFYTWTNVTLSTKLPHYVLPGLVSTWGDPEANIRYVSGSYDEATGFDVNFVLERQLNNELPLLLLIISMTYMLGATLLEDARWKPEVKTAVYLSFFVMVAGFNFALRYLIPFRYGLTVAEVLFITLTVATAIFSIGFIISNIMHTRFSQKRARIANLVLDLSAVCISGILLAIFSVPTLLLAIEVVGLSFGFIIRIAFIDRSSNKGIDV